MLRVSVTDVDAVRYWLDQPDGTREDLRDRLLHVTPPTAEQLVGRGLHAWIETARPGDQLTSIRYQGIEISLECEVQLETLPIGEWKVSRVIDFGALGWVEVVGKVDRADLVTVVDYKTTQRFDPEALVDSMQWRLYLWLTGARRFAWDVFEVKQPLRDEPDRWRICGHHRLDQHWYPELETDCLLALLEFVRLVREHVPEYVAKQTRRVEALT